MRPATTSRGKAMRWLSTHRGITEQPYGSNRDHRRDGITAAQRRLGTWLIGQAWCGVWACNAAMAGGVRPAKPYRWASVSLIEDDARAGHNGFRDWTHDPRHVLRGDLVVLFGRGHHVETVRSIHRRLGFLVCDGGNTSSGSGGSQSNGGGSFRRIRRLRDVHGFARIDFPNR